MRWACEPHEPARTRAHTHGHRKTRAAFFHCSTIPLCPRLVSMPVHFSVWYATTDKSRHTAPRSSISRGRTVAPGASIKQGLQRDLYSLRALPFTLRVKHEYSSHTAGCLLRGFFMNCLSSKTCLTTEEDVDVTQTYDG